MARDRSMKDEVERAVERLQPGGRVRTELVYRKARDPSETGTTVLEIEREGRGYAIRDHKRPDRLLRADTRERALEAVRKILASVVQVRSLETQHSSASVHHGRGGAAIPRDLTLALRGPDDFGAAIESFLRMVFQDMMSLPMLGSGMAPMGGTVIILAGPPSLGFGPRGMPMLPAPPRRARYGRE